LLQRPTEPEVNSDDDDDQQQQQQQQQEDKEDDGQQEADQAKQHLDGNTLLQPSQDPEYQPSDEEEQEEVASSDSEHLQQTPARVRGRQHRAPTPADPSQNEASPGPADSVLTVDVHDQPEVKMATSRLAAALCGYKTVSSRTVLLRTSAAEGVLKRTIAKAKQKIREERQRQQQQQRRQRQRQRQQQQRQQQQRQQRQQQGGSGNVAEELQQAAAGAVAFKGTTSPHPAESEPVLSQDVDDDEDIQSLKAVDHAQLLDMCATKDPRERDAKMKVGLKISDTLDRLITMAKLKLKKRRQEMRTAGHQAETGAEATPGAAGGSGAAGQVPVAAAANQAAATSQAAAASPPAAASPCLAASGASHQQQTQAPPPMVS
jgi:hypothetical protein